MIIQQYPHNDTFICVEMQCPFCRIITSWDQLKLHNQFNHKIISKQKLDSKYNEQQRIKVQEDIYQLIQYQEEKIIFKIQELFEFLKKTYLNIVQDQIYFDYQLQSLSNQYFIEADLQKYIEIYYGQIQTPQQDQVALFLNEIQSKLNLMEDNFLNLLEQNFIIGNQMSNNIYKQDTSGLNESTIPESIMNKSNGIQENHYQTEFISNEAEQMKYEIQSIQYDSNISQQQSTQQIEQDDLNNIPLKGYKQLQLQQQKQSYHTENISQKDDDRLKFQLPSETINSPKYSNRQSNNEQDLYVPKTEAQVYFFEDNPKQQQNKKKEQITEWVKKPSPQDIFFGKKFDLINSHKHLKFSLNNQTFLCHQQGIGLVEGILTLKIDAEIRLKFSEPQKKNFQAEIGIQNVDKDGKRKGNLQYCMNEIGELISNNQVYKGKLKITLNQEYLISYSSKERMLYFINGKTEEYLDLDKVQGNFKFYVKLYGLKVSILY